MKYFKKKIKKKIAKLQNEQNPLIRTIVHFLQIFNPNLYKKTAPEDYLSIACIVKNEGSYIKEWVEYHKLVGVDRIYIYDNESNDNTKEILQEYIDEGFVIYTFEKGEIRQMPAYRHAIKNFGHKTFWLAFVDADEFIVPVKNENLKETLKEFEKYPALAVNWVVYDGNGHLKKPEGLVIENYTKTHKTPSKDDLLIKVIVQAEYVWCTGQTPHNFIYKKGKFAFNENGEKVLGPRNEKYSVEKIKINHYCSKSLEEYKTKLSKGCADCYCKMPVNMKVYEFKDGIENLTMKKYFVRLKQKCKI